ncbi:hypothetical protein LSTR_LSTR004087 [Laodelphax striatellus]|uniref:Endonuclease-reverse transcriptase n=1 Tax=Laodelphax striatellus TaxID=195883 RepID=A0A482WGJ7_LAOST|nr:hypothetical protein LSTR_LSTR004087 [Laodelphax striatellus]
MEVDTIAMEALLERFRKDIENEDIKQDIQEQNILIDRIRRENNLIFFGINETNNEREVIFYKRKVLDICNRVLSVELKSGDINFVRRIGKRNESKKRPILLSLVSSLKKTSIMQHCGRLKNSNVFRGSRFRQENAGKAKGAQWIE